MKVEAWIRFENPGEKEKLKEIMTRNESNSILANMEIQEAFGISMLDANTVIDMYKTRIKK